eukprot:2253321-Rhodomonas_salina.1
MHRSCTVLAICANMWIASYCSTMKMRMRCHRFMSWVMVVRTCLGVRCARLMWELTLNVMVTPGGAQNSARVAFVSPMKYSTREGTYGATSTSTRLNSSMSITWARFALGSFGAAACLRRGMGWGNSGENSQTIRSAVAEAKP